MRKMFAMLILMFASSFAFAQCVSSQVVNGTLQKGQSIYTDCGFGNLYTLYMQWDGNVVLYAGTSSGKALWATNTVGKGGEYLHVQEDGNLVLYTANRTPVWDSKTNTSSWGYNTLQIESNGNLALYYTGLGPTRTTYVYKKPGTTPPGTCTTARQYAICVFPGTLNQFNSFVLACSQAEAAQMAAMSAATLGSCR